jgi:hypothetical protein
MAVKRDELPIFPPGRPSLDGEPLGTGTGVLAEGGQLVDAANAKVLAGKFLRSFKSKQKDKKSKGDVQSMLAARTTAWQQKSSSSASGSNPPLPQRPAAMDDAVWHEVCAQLGIAADGSGLTAEQYLADQEYADHREKKKKKKRKHHKSRHRSRMSSYSSASSSSSEASSVFRGASTRKSGRDNVIAEVARRTPGRLFTEGLKTMAKFCDPTNARTSGGETMPVAAYQYLTTLGTAAQGMNLPRGAQREMQTLAICRDHLARGNTAALGDVLMQRFKAVESSASSTGWEVAQHLELVPHRQFSATSMREQEAAARMTIRESQLQKALKGNRDDSRYPKGSGG